MKNIILGLFCIVYGLWHFYRTLREKSAWTTWRDPWRNSSLSPKKIKILSFIIMVFMESAGLFLIISYFIE
jgi:hypothetical protein